MSDPDEGLHIVSHFPGRLRVRARKLRQDPAAREATVQRLRGEPGVESVTASALTGSILVLYDPKRIQVDTLVAAALEGGSLKGVAPDGREHLEGTAAATYISQSVAGMDRDLFRAAGGRLDLRTAVPGALAIGGFATLLFGRLVLPQWYDLVFWSYVTFNNLNLAGRPRRAERTADSNDR